MLDRRDFLAWIGIGAAALPLLSRPAPAAGFVDEPMPDYVADSCGDRVIYEVPAMQSHVVEIIAFSPIVYCRKEQA